MHLSMKSILQRLFVLVAVVIMSTISVDAQARRALLVGISAYKSPLNGYTWDNIHGANDVALVSSALKRQGFLCTELTDATATHDNIISAFNSLVAASKPGDIVLFMLAHPTKSVAGLTKNQRYTVEKERNVPYSPQLASESLQFGVK